MQIYEEEISIRGKPVKVAAIRVDNNVVTIQGKFIKTARIEDEWYEDVKDPESIIRALKDSKIKADIFTFWQRPPETKPKYNYYMEWDNIAALPVKSYEHWYKTQINTNAKRAIKKAEKRGVVVKKAKFNDEFIQGMKNIFNETPIRQGKPFIHYGKDFETVKREFSKYLYREDLIGAYYNNELIGFIFLAYAGKYALTGQIISEIEHRDKAPNNALIAKAVEICDEKKIPYLVYFYWGSGSFSEFKRRNGFIKTAIPRYYIPLSVKGKILLKLKLHHGVVGMIPENLKVRLMDLRKQWYTRTTAKSSKKTNNHN